MAYNALAWNFKSFPLVITLATLRTLKIYFILSGAKKEPTKRKNGARGINKFVVFWQRRISARANAPKMRSHKNKMGVYHNMVITIKSCNILSARFITTFQFCGPDVVHGCWSRFAASDVSEIAAQQGLAGINWPINYSAAIKAKKEYQPELKVRVER